MITEDCDRCGRIVRLRLDQDVSVCAGCGAQVRLQPAVAQRVAAARAALFQMDARKRQLTGRQRGAIEGSSGWMVLLLLVVGLACLPFGGCAAYSIGTESIHPSDRLYLVFTMSMPLLVMGGVGVLVVYAFRRAHARLLRACAARPPTAPGEAACCHVCGGPLASAGGPIARCTFCGADNVVTAEAMARAQHVEARGATDVEAAVRREAAAVASSSGLLVLVTAAAVFVVPIVLAIVDVAIFFTARTWERPLDDTLEYSSYDAPEGQCVGLTHDGKVNAGSPRGWIPLGGRRTFRAASLVGKRVRPRAAKTMTFATVTKVSSSPFYGNMVTIDHPDAHDLDDRVEVVAICIEP